MKPEKPEPDLSRNNLGALIAIRETLAIVSEIALGHDSKKLKAVAKAMSEVSLSEKRSNDLEEQFGEDCSFGYTWMMRYLIDRLGHSAPSTRDPNETDN